MESAGRRRLRLLFLSQRFPCPMDTGGKIRTGKLLERLKDVFEITLISNVESPKDDVYLPHVQQLCTRFYPIPWREVKKYTVPFYARLLARSLSRYPVTVANDRSRDVEATIGKLLVSERYDLLVCDFLQSSVNIRKLTDHPTLLFQHNVESVIVARHLATAHNPLARLFWWSQLLKMERYERWACQQFTCVVTVSNVDKTILEQRFSAKNVYAIPTGVDTDYFYPCNDPVDANGLVFAGAMDWLPNEDGVLFFVKEILEKIKKHVPAVRLTVVGRNPSRRLLKELRRHPEVRVVGWVEDVRPLISRHAVYVIPLRIGGGTRIKAYEAMAMGKAVVSTSIGAEGLPVTNGQHVVLADSAEKFAGAVVEFLRNRAARQRLGENARAFVTQNCGWDKVTAAFADICRAVVDGWTPRPVNHAGEDALCMGGVHRCSVPPQGGARAAWP